LEGSALLPAGHSAKLKQAMKERAGGHGAEIAFVCGICVALQTDPREWAMGFPSDVDAYPDR